MIILRALRWVCCLGKPSARSAWPRALSSGNTAWAEKILRAHPELATNTDGMGFGITSLHTLAFAPYSTRAMVRLLLDYGADVNARDRQGWTPLTYALKHHKTAIAEVLLSRGATYKCLACQQPWLRGTTSCQSCGRELSDLAKQEASPQHAELEQRQKNPQKQEQVPQSGPASGFFLFDYAAMDAAYGHQAFSAIRDALINSSGICAFCDGDVSCETVRRQARQAAQVTPVGPESPLASLGQPFDFGAYLLAMWTDSSSAFRKIHSYLSSAETPGYLGYMTLPGAHDRAEFLGAVQARLFLVRSLAFVDGVLDPTTDKFGLS